MQPVSTKGICLLKVFSSISTKLLYKQRGIMTLEDVNGNNRLKTEGQGYQGKTSFIWDDAYPTRKHLRMLKQ
jgi:hypothetical protein